METMALEQYILSAERAFEQNEFLEGKRYLFEALTIEPNFGKAHNHLGWLYLFHFNEWDKAESHLKMALKYAPGYRAAYMHMSHLLFEKGKFDELIDLLKKAITIGGVQKSFLFNEYGRINEVRSKFGQAIKHYKLAVKWCFDDQELIILKENIRRCRSKRWILMF